MKFEVALIGRIHHTDSFDAVWGVVSGERVFALGLTREQAEEVLRTLSK